MAQLLSVGNTPQNYFLIFLIDLTPFFGLKSSQIALFRFRWAIVCTKLHVSMHAKDQLEGYVDSRDDLDQLWYSRTSDLDVRTRVPWSGRLRF